MNTKPLESLGHKAPETTKRTEPNTNLMKVAEIQGLISQITDILYTIEPHTDKQKAILSMSKDEISGYEATTIFVLQSELE